MKTSGKATVLFMPEGSVLAHVGRSLAIAEALEGEGVNTCFAASGRHERWLREAGKRVLPAATLSREKLLGRLRKGGSAFDATTLERYVEEELRVLEDADADVVVGDFRPSLGISARVCGVPYVSVTNAVWTRYYLPRLDPPESWLPTRILGKRLLKMLAPALEQRVFRHYAAPFNRVRRKYGLPAQEDVRDCMCSERLTLIADCPALFPSKELPPNFRYVGPIIWEPPVQPPEWISRLDGDRAVAYVTMGSTGARERIGALAEALMREGIQVICTTGAGGAEGLPQGCHGVEYGPGGRLCEAADVVVCHAGNGTIYQALWHGCPVLGVPEFHDQEFSMQRVQALGLGRGVRLGKAFAQEAARGVKALLREERLAGRVGVFRDFLRGYGGGAARAARLIMECAGATAGRTAGVEMRRHPVAAWTG